MQFTQLCGSDACVTCLRLDSLFAVVHQHSQCIVSVHMCDGTNRSKEDGRYQFGSDLSVLSLSSWLCVPHLEAKSGPQWKQSCSLL